MPSFTFGEAGKDEIVREGIVDEADCLGGLGVGWGGEGFGHIDGLGEDILGALFVARFVFGVDVDGLFAVGGGLHEGLLLLLMERVVVVVVMNI